VEADEFTPVAGRTQRPVVGPACGGFGTCVVTSAVSPGAINLYLTIQRLKLDVAQIAALHGPRIATLSDLAVSIGKN
jgi:hypothetical protein